MATWEARGRAVSAAISIALHLASAGTVPLTGCLQVSSGRVFNGKTGQPAALPLHVRPSMYHTATTVAGAHEKLPGGRGGRSKLLEWAKVSFLDAVRNATSRKDTSVSRRRAARAARDVCRLG